MYSSGECPKLLHVAARIENQVTENLTIAAVFRFEKIVNGNEQFAADRYTTGLLAIFDY